MISAFYLINVGILWLLFRFQKKQAFALAIANLVILLLFLVLHKGSPSMIRL